MTAAGAAPVGAVQEGAAQEGVAQEGVATGRLLLRLPRTSDAAVLAGIADDWEVAGQTASLPHPFARADADAWIAKAHAAVAGGARLMVIELRDGAAPIGVLRIAPKNGHYELGYWIGRRY